MRVNTVVTCNFGHRTLAVLVSQQISLPISQGTEDFSCIGDPHQQRTTLMFMHSLYLFLLCVPNGLFSKISPKPFDPRLNGSLTLKKRKFISKKMFFVENSMYHFWTVLSETVFHLSRKSVGALLRNFQTEGKNMFHYCNSQTLDPPFPFWTVGHKRTTVRIKSGNFCFQRLSPFGRGDAQIGLAEWENMDFGTYNMWVFIGGKSNLLTTKKEVAMNNGIPKWGNISK